MFSESKSDESQDNYTQLKPKSSSPEKQDKFPLNGGQMNTAEADYGPHNINQYDSSQADLESQAEKFSLQEETNSSETINETPVEDILSLDYHSLGKIHC